MNRRNVITVAAASFAAGAINRAWTVTAAEANTAFPISLAQWSHHRALKGGKLDNLDWPAHAKDKFGITALEWVNQFFWETRDKLGHQPKSADYLAEMKKRCDDIGTKTVLIMCDGVGDLGNPDSEKRSHAVEGHYAWLDAAKLLGGHSIRVNARSNPSLSYAEQADLCVDGLRRLSEKAATMDLNVIVENHGGLSSSGAWLAEVMKKVNLPNCGTLPDFGNFYVARNRGTAEQFENEKKLYSGEHYIIDEKGIAYDRYQGVADLMPFAKGVSAKSHDFDVKTGDEIHTDFARMMKIVKDSGYQGHVGIEYEGGKLSEDDGVLATKTLLEKVFANL